MCVHFAGRGPIAGLDTFKVVPFKTAHLREKEMAHGHTKDKVGSFAEIRPIRPCAIGD